MGKVKVRINVDKKTGAYKAEVVDHADGASCALGKDEGILNDLMNAEIPGFGGSDPAEHGPTEEWKEYCSRNSRKEGFEESPDAFSDDFDHHEEDRQLDNGFGV